MSYAQLVHCIGLHIWTTILAPLYPINKIVWEGVSERFITKRMLSSNILSKGFNLPKICTYLLTHGYTSLDGFITLLLPEECPIANRCKPVDPNSSLPGTSSNRINQKIVLGRWIHKRRETTTPGNQQTCTYNRTILILSPKKFLLYALDALFCKIYKSFFCPALHATNITNMVCL